MLPSLAATPLLARWRVRLEGMTEPNAEVRVELRLQGHDNLSLLLFSGDPMFPDDLGWSDAYDPSDSLGKLFRALRDALNGAESVDFAWDQRPGEQKWTITSLPGSDTVHVLVEESGYLLRDDDEEGRNQVLVDFIAPLPVLARAIVREASRIRNDPGPGSYDDHWELYPFPSDALDELSDALASRKAAG